jgi:hypothetical protein
MATNAFEIPGLRFSLVSSADNIKRYRFLSVTEDGTAALASASSAIVGVSMNQVDAVDRPVEIADGIVIVEAAGAITAGSYVASNAEGKATSSENATGLIALTTADAAGQYVSVKFL